MSKLIRPFEFMNMNDSLKNQEYRRVYDAFKDLRDSLRVYLEDIDSYIARIDKTDLKNELNKYEFK